MWRVEQTRKSHLDYTTSKEYLYPHIFGQPDEQRPRLPRRRGEANANVQDDVAHKFALKV